MKPSHPNHPQNHPTNTTTTITPNTTNNATNIMYQYAKNDTPLFRFQSTKLRSWLIGYPRILALHRTYLATIDPDTFEVTNTFSYHSIRQWKALPNKGNSKSTTTVISNTNATMDGSSSEGTGTYTIEIAQLEVLENDGSATKLKFKLAERAKFLTELARLTQEYDTKRSSSSSSLSPSSSSSSAFTNQPTATPSSNYPSFKALRQLRSGTTSECVLMIHPYAICEWSNMDTGFMRIVREYRYMDMDAFSITCDDVTGFIVYHHGGGSGSNCNTNYRTTRQPSKARLFYIQGNRNARTDLIHFIKLAYEKIGCAYNLSESVPLEYVLERHAHYGKRPASISSSTPHLSSSKPSRNQSMFDIGDVLSTYRVSKPSTRHPEAVEGIQRYLHITNQGILIEEDAPVTRFSSSKSKSYSSSSSSPPNISSNSSIVTTTTSNKPYRPPSLGKVISYWDLNSIHAIIRVHTSSTLLKLEFKNGKSRIYSAMDRDALAVILYDACWTLVHHTSVILTDLESDGYRYIPRSMKSNTQKKSKGFHRGSSSPNFGSLTVEVAQMRQLVAFVQDAISESESSGEGSSISEEMVLEAILVAREFNANVSMEGISQDMDKKLWNLAISSLFQLMYTIRVYTYVSKQSNAVPTILHPSLESDKQCAVLLQSVFRILQSPYAFQYTAECGYVLKCFESPSSLLEMDDHYASYWAVRVLSLLIYSCPVEVRNREQEYVNKQVILNKQNVLKNLVLLLVDATGKEEPSDTETQTSVEDRIQEKRPVSNLLLMAVSEAIENIVCTANDTTTPIQFKTLASALCTNYVALMEILRSPCPIIVENAALLLQTISTFHPPTATKIREFALSSGILLHHFYCSIFSPMEGQRFLSRYLVGLWMKGPANCSEKKLLKRILPSGFLPYLAMPLLSDMELDNLDEMERSAALESIDNFGRLLISSSDHVSAENSSWGESGGSGIYTKRMSKRIQVSNAASKGGGGGASTTPSENFRILFHVLTKDHALPDLIWNQQTRRQLRISLETELSTLEREIDLRGGAEYMAWNHQQFSVEYPSLREEVKVGTVYMRLWIQAGDSFIKQWEEPEKLFELLFRRLLCDIDRDMNVSNMCIRCLERLYLMHSDKIGVFEDVMILVRSMAVTKSTESQHRLLSLIATLLGVSDNREHYGLVHVPGNAEQMLNSECISHFCQFIAFGHINGGKFHNVLSTGGNLELGASPLRLTNGMDVNDLPPRVWYVAPAGKIPPPAKRIRGPFHVSELKNFMDLGELHPHSLVSNVHRSDGHDDVDEKRMKDNLVDTGKWQMIEQVWQLRWQLCSDGSIGVHNPVEVSNIAVRALSRLVALHKSTDPRGVPYHPIPIAKQLLCGLSRDPSFSTTHGVYLVVDRKEALPIISQSLLRNDAQLVDSTADLLSSLMAHNNEACSKLYLTGVFFFACAYPGSNFRSLANFFHSTHLGQDFRLGFDAAANTNELLLKQRSILGNMLPEGLLFMLVNYGVERFTEVFVGDFDTPEVIWSLEMRKHLIEMIRQHLGDFPYRLCENTIDTYEYCPIPSIAYERLENELFCHNYYLHNLCNEERFPDWPIAEPIEVFRACLEEWKKQMSRDQGKEEDAQEEARVTLQLKSGDGGHQLRKAYRILARKFHPDRNPAGREMFEKVQLAYELLLPVVEGGGKIIRLNGHEKETNEHEIDCSQGLGGGMAQMSVIHLLIKTQIIICKRHAKEIGSYKYPAYSMLLSCLQIPAESLDNPDGSFLSSYLLKPKRAEFICSAMKLVFQTCLVSPLNANEIVAENGINILEPLLSFYIRAVKTMYDKKRTNETSSIGEDIATIDLILEIITQIVRTISGIVYFEPGRQAISESKQLIRFCLSWRQCLDGNLLGNHATYKYSALIKKYCLEGVVNMSRNADLQNRLMSCGILWPLVRCLLGYDTTLEQVSVEHDEQGSASMNQAASNSHAKLAARSIGMLSGIMLEQKLQTPPNQDIFRVMKVILTQPIAGMLRNQRSGKMLKILNSDVEKATCIWNSQMREELTLALDKLDNEKEESGLDNADGVERFISTFQYSSLCNEVNIGGVFLRIFNSLGGGNESIRDIPDTNFFAKKLLNFIALCLERSEEIKYGQSSESQKNMSLDVVANDQNFYPLDDSRFTMAVEALRNLVQVDGLIDDVIYEDGNNGPFVLFSMLRIPHQLEAFDISSDIVSIMSSRQSFADAIVRQGQLCRLFEVLYQPDDDEIETSANNFIMEQKDEDESKNVSPQLTQIEAYESSSITNLMKRRRRDWNFLEALVANTSIAQTILRCSAWLELLGIIVGYSKFTKLMVARLGAANALSKLLWDPENGQYLGSLLGCFLPTSLTIMLKEEGGDAVIRAFDRDTENPELIWDGEMRNELRTSIAGQLDICLDQYREKDSDNFTLPPNFYIQYTKLEQEFFIGNVYIKLFLKKPTFSLRDPTMFLEILMKRWCQEIEGSCKEVSENPFQNTSLVNISNQVIVQLLSDTIVCLCKAQANIVHKLALWGYMPILTTYLQQLIQCHLIHVPLVSTVRVIHIAASQKSNVEALSTIGGNSGKNGIVDHMIQAIGSDPLHIDSGFIIKVLKEIFLVALGDLTSSKESEKHKDSNEFMEQTVEKIDNNSDVVNSTDENIPGTTMAQNTIDLNTVPAQSPPLSDEISPSENDMQPNPQMPMPSEPPPPLPSEPPPPPPQEMGQPSSLTEDPSFVHDDQNIMGGNDQNGNSLTDEAYSYTPTPIFGGGVDATSSAPHSLVAERQTVSILGAPGSIKGRPLLLHSGLECSLPQFLVEQVLENPGLENVKDPSAATVNAIELLKLLTMDPGYGMKYNLILNCLPNWEKYKSLDHSLLLTGRSNENESYFLTDDAANETKMLSFS